MLAHEYGIVSQTFLDALSPEEKIFIDSHLLNRLIDAENKAIEKQREEAERSRKMPGVSRMVSAEERAEQLRCMRVKKIN